MALQEWAAEPARPRRLLVRGLEAVARACGATGAHLEVVIEPSVSVVAGWGTLARRPGRSVRGSVVAMPLHGEGRRRRHRRLRRRPAGDALARRPPAITLKTPCASSSSPSRAPATVPRLIRAERRLAAVDEAIRAMAGVLAVDRVLQVIVDRVRILTGARYAALGVHDQSGAIEQFITSGIGRPERARIGAPRAATGSSA